MADLITEPNRSNPDTQAWLDILNKLTSTTGAFNVIDFNNKNNTDVPYILEGSRFEVNGSFYYVSSNELINNFANISINTFAYAYAKPNIVQKICVFEFEGGPANAPVWDAKRGGWFHPSNNWRALLSCIKTANGQCRCKSLMDKRFIYTAPNDNDSAILVQSTSSINEDGTTIEIESGWYYITITPASGGNGGTGGASGATFMYHNGTANAASRPGTAGDSGNTPAQLTFKIWLEKGTLQILRGYNGANGGVGTKGADYEISYTTSGEITTPTANLALNGGDGGDGGKGQSTIIMNNGQIVLSVDGGDGGRGGNGGVAASSIMTSWPQYQLTDIGTQTQRQNAVRNKKPKGARGTKGNLSTTRGGSIYVYAM